jgi:hypothetical protein
MKTIEENVIEWAKERDLIKPENATKQVFKLVEEVGEIFGAYLKNEIDGVKDGIGDAQVVLIILLEQLGQKRKTCCLGVEMIQNDFDKILMGLSNSVGRICHTFIGWNRKSVHYYHIELCFMYLEKIAEKHNTTLNECLELAYNEIKNRKGKTVNGSFIREK